MDKDASCALDVAERGWLTVEEVGELIGVGTTTAWDIILGTVEELKKDKRYRGLATMLEEKTEKDC